MLGRDRRVLPDRQAVRFRTAFNTGSEPEFPAIAGAGSIESKPARGRDPCLTNP